ncbi:MAG: hypothetical protein U0892_22620 [Pirellulales bacterium]
MTFIYTGRDIRTALESEPDHGAKYAFALKEFDQRGFTFGVQDTGFFGGKYEVSDHGITIDVGAGDLSTAVQWAKNALREWAGGGVSAKTYFAETARAWAIDKKGSFPNCMGSTVDFLYLFSGASASSSDRTMKMYGINMGMEEVGMLDVARIYLWVFVNWWTPFGQTQDHIMVHPALSDLHSDYIDSLNSIADQSHHYAFYFWVGVNFGAGELVMSKFLEKTHDLDEKWKKILNKGDYYLGYLAARHGQSLKKNDRFMGAQIESELKSPFPDKGSMPQASLDRNFADPWVNEDREVAHPASPNGKGGLGRMALSRMASYQRTELPHPNSPAARTVDPLDFYHYQRIVDASEQG